MLKRMTTAAAVTGLMLTVGLFSAPAASAASLVPGDAVSVPPSVIDATPAAAALVPVVGTPVLTITPNTCMPTPKIVTWAIPEGLAIGGVTGTGQSVDEEAAILDAAIGGTQRPRSWILPVTVLDGFTYGGPATVTLVQARECVEPAPEPTPAPEPDPTPEPTEGATAPTPGNGQVPPAAPVVQPVLVAQPVQGASAPVEQDASARTTSPVASAVSPTRELAYTGADPATTIGGSLAAGIMVALGSIILVKRRQPRARRAD